MPKIINLSKTCQELAKKFKMELAFGQQFPHELAELSRPSDDSLEKQWTVHYRIWSEAEQRTIRKRKEVSGTTLAKRRKRADQLISDINMLLENGAFLDPSRELSRNDTYPWL